MKLFLLAGICIEMLLPIQPNDNKKHCNEDKHISPSVSSCTDSISLTNRKWDMQEIRFLQDNQPFYYQRENDKGNTINFDDDYIVFQSDGSGIYHQSDGTDFTIIWRWIAGSKQAIDYTIKNFRNNNDLQVHWEEVEISGNTLKYTEYYTHASGIHSLGRATRFSNPSRFYLINNCLINATSTNDFY